MAELEESRKLEQLPEFIRRKTRLPGYVSHRKGVDGIMPRDLESANSIRHGDMFTLPDDLKSSFFERPNSLQMIYTGEPRHGLEVG
jgi:hypothetical protein